MAVQPAPGDVHVDAMLTNVLVAWIQNQSKYIARRLFPNVPSQFQSGIIPQYSLADLYRNEAKKRAPGDESFGSGWATDLTATYFCDVWAYHHDIPGQVRSNTQSPFDQDRDTTAIVGQKMAIGEETQFATNFFATSKWSRDWTGANSADTTHKVYWDLPGSSPIEDVMQECDTIEQKTGFRPNKLGLGGTVFTGLSLNPEFIDRVKYGGNNVTPGQVTMQAIAAVFGLDEVLVSRAVSNTAAEGATANTGYIAGKNALLVYAADAPGILVPSAGYTFSWSDFYGAGPGGARMKKFYLPRNDVDRVEGEAAYSQKIIATALGTFFSNISST